MPGITEYNIKDELGELHINVEDKTNVVNFNELTEGVRGILCKYLQSGVSLSEAEVIVAKAIQLLEGAIKKNATKREKTSIQVGEKITIQEFTRKIGKSLVEVMKALPINKIVAPKKESVIDFNTAQLVGLNFEVNVYRKEIPHSTYFSGFVLSNPQTRKLLDQDYDVKKKKLIQSRKKKRSKNKSPTTSPSSTTSPPVSSLRT